MIGLKIVAQMQLLDLADLYHKPFRIETETAIARLKNMYVSFAIAFWVSGRAIAFGGILNEGALESTLCKPRNLYHFLYHLLIAKIA